MKKKHSHRKSKILKKVCIAKPGQILKDLSENKIREYLPLTLEALTPSLIKELIGKGWDPDALDHFKSEAFMYNRKRNSFVSPHELFGIEA